MTAGIYRIKNKINNHIYIGSAINLENRKSEHFSRLQDNKHPNTYLQRAFNKYGKKNFDFEILYLVPEKSKLISIEQYFINTRKPEYNICLVAGNCLGRIATEETKRKRKLYMTGFANKHHSDETKKKISDAKKGKKFSEEHKKKISASLKGHLVSNITKKKIGAIHKGKVLSEETKKKISVYWENRRLRRG